MDRFLVLDDKHMYGEGTSAAIYKQSLIEFAYIIGRGEHGQFASVHVFIRSFKSPEAAQGIFSLDLVIILFPHHFPIEMFLY